MEASPKAPKSDRKRHFWGPTPHTFDRRSPFLRGHRFDHSAQGGFGGNAHEDISFANLFFDQRLEHSRFRAAFQPAAKPLH